MVTATEITARIRVNINFYCHTATHISSFEVGDVSVIPEIKNVEA